MRDDQLKRLEQVQERLLDVVMQEADPDTWPGVGKPIGEMSQQERGDRYWCKKNAAATLSLIAKTLSIQSYAKDNHAPANTPEDEVDIEKELRRHEQSAEKLLREFKSRHHSGLVGNA